MLQLVCCRAFAARAPITQDFAASLGVDFAGDSLQASVYICLHFLSGWHMQLPLQK